VAAHIATGLTRSLIQGNEFLSSVTDQNGIITMNNTSAIENILRGFGFALQHSFTTTAVVINNVSIGAASGLALKTGHAPFAEANNFPR